LAIKVKGTPSLDLTVIAGKMEKQKPKPEKEPG